MWNLVLLDSIRSVTVLNGDFVRISSWSGGPSLSTHEKASAYLGVWGIASPRKKFGTHFCYDKTWVCSQFTITHYVSTKLSTSTLVT